MKLIHFADLHLGVESYGKIDPVSGLSTRLLDILRALDILVEEAIRQQVDLVVFCGDTYKNRDPSQTHQREFAKRLRRLSEADIPVFLLVGNHDLPNSVGRATAVEIFDTLAVRKIYIGSSFDLYHVPTKSGEIQIVALPWPRKNVLLSRDDLKNLTIEKLNQRIEQAMTDGLENILNKINPKLPSILAAHVSVSNAKQGSEKTMLVGRDPVMLLSNIARPEFDYIALGHMHQHQILNSSPPVVYSGSLECLDFSDEGQEKGFYIVDIENENGNKSASYKFHKVDARRFVTIMVELQSNDLSPVTTILAEIDKNRDKIRGAIVKLQIYFPRALEKQIKEGEIYKALQEAYYVCIGKGFKQEARSPLSIEAIEELMPLDALRIYLESKKVPEDRIKILLEYGEKLIREVHTGEG